jgi:uncharacterized protein
MLIKGTTSCNLKCAYCYEKDIGHLIESGLVSNSNVIRQKAKELRTDMPGIQAALHGGECLLLGHCFVGLLLESIYRNEGRSSLVTNGTLIDDKFIGMFKEYKCEIAISMDGPWPLNRLRGYPDDEERCKQYTDELMETIYRMADEGIIVRMLCTFNKANEDYPDEMIEWIQDLARHGITCGRVNLVKGEYAPDPKKWEIFLKKLVTLTVLVPGINWHPVANVSEIFITGRCSECSNLPCDPFCTHGSHTLLGDGRVTSCLMSQAFMLHGNRCPTALYWREDWLSKTPVEDGGCMGCKYWTSCYGGCPGGGQDWRLKDHLCESRYRTFKVIEEYLRDVGIEPIFPPSVLVEPIETWYRRVERTVVVPDRYSDTTVNGIRLKETPDVIEVWYNGKE